MLNVNSRTWSPAGPLGASLGWLLLAGCPGILGETAETGNQETGDVTPPETLSIVGTYSEDWDGDGQGDSTHVISDSEWTMTSESGVSVFVISQFSNDESLLIAQNDASNDFAPEKWSRFDWAADGSTLWFCQTTYEAQTESDALEIPAANADDPSTSGCGEFAWSQLTQEE